MPNLATQIRDVDQLEEMLSKPTPELVETMRRLKGDILILGVGGKMGVTLSRMARRASDAAGIERRIVGVSRFSESGVEEKLHTHGIETIRCDLLEHDQVAALPAAENIVFMAGMKFGTSGNEPMTWAMNTVLPGIVAKRYGGSKILVFLTGNVYPLTPVEQGGSRETDQPQPVGEYAYSCLGRQRVFEYFCNTLKSPTAVLRLNYAVETRYGVLVDIAQKVWNEEPVDVTMGYVNVIWQGDANAMILRSFDHVSVPATMLNVVGPEALAVRDIALQFGDLMGKQVHITGREAPDALLSNGTLGYAKLGRPQIGREQMIRWIADWIMRGGQCLAKPTHFECRDGKF